MRIASATNSDVAHKIEQRAYFCLLIPASLTTYFFGRVYQLSDAVNLAVIVLVVAALCFFSRALATAVVYKLRSEGFSVASELIGLLVPRLCVGRPARLRNFTPQLRHWIGH